MPKKASFEESAQDRLMLDSINKYGYGIVARFVMRDPDLPLQSKGIYSYLCSRCGNGDTAFPGRDTILRDLGIGKAGYYKYRQYLIDQGYIRVERVRKNGLLSHNVYILVSNPKKISEMKPENEWQERTYNTIEQEGLKAAGYGMIPLLVMTDTRLTINDKAVYSYFCSWAGAGRVAFPKAAQILRDLNVSQNTYLKAMKNLREFGYIIVIQANGGSGKKGFSSNHYILTNDPKKHAAENRAKTEEPAHIKMTDIVETDVDKSDISATDNAGSDMALSDVASSDMISSSMVSADITSQDTNINTPPKSKTSSSKSINQSINTAAKPPSTPPPKPATQPFGWMDRWDDEEENDYESLIKANVQYDDIPLLFDYLDVEKAKELTLLLITACESTSETIRIGGEVIPIERVRKRFLSLNADHLKYVIESVRPYDGTIRNVRAYYLAALYHATETMESHYSNSDNMVE